MEYFMTLLQVAGKWIMLALVAGISGVIIFFVWIILFLIIHILTTKMTKAAKKYIDKIKEEK